MLRSGKIQMGIFFCCFFTSIFWVLQFLFSWTLTNSFLRQKKTLLRFLNFPKFEYSFLCSNTECNVSMRRLQNGNLKICTITEKILLGNSLKWWNIHEFQLPAFAAVSLADFPFPAFLAAFSRAKSRWFPRVIFAWYISEMKINATYIFTGTLDSSRERWTGEKKKSRMRCKIDLV